MNNQTFYVYIVTNWQKSVLYVGVTNDMSRRLYEHHNGLVEGFTRKYSCKYLIYYEEHQYITNAIQCEKEIKGWSRKKKEKLISSFNLDWVFLNERFMRLNCK